MFLSINQKVKISKKKLLQMGKGPTDGRGGQREGDIKRIEMCYGPVPIPHSEYRQYVHFIHTNMNE